MTPTQFDIEAEKLVGTVIKACYDIEQTKPGVIKVVEEALNQLHNLYVQGKIEELEQLIGRHFKDKLLQERIATLEAQLTLKGDKDE